MAGTLIARELHKAHGAATILAGVSVTVAPGDVLGVVGPNGAGKSTLLRLLAGIDRPDRGTVRLTAGAAGYLPQEPDRAPGERLQDYLARRTGVAAADARVHEATDAMAAEAPGAAEAYAHAFEGWLALGGADLEPRAETVLRDLGLDPALLELETVALSGGQAARAALAAILLSRFDVLLLDEPTNDLDFDGLARLERFVAERPGGAVIVSHDRAFLERTVTRVLEIDEIAHTAAEYGGGWAGYQELRATAARHAEERYDDVRDRARPADRPRAPPAPVVGDRRAQGQDQRRAGQERQPGAHAALGEAGVEGARLREGARAPGGGRQAVAALGAAAALRRRRALRRRDGAARRRGDAARQLRARPARPRARLGRARGARRSQRLRQDDARGGAARPPAARVRHALGRPRRADRDARPGARGLRRRGLAARRVRRAAAGSRSRRHARCWPSSGSRATRSRAPRARSRPASARAPASRS